MNNIYNIVFYLIFKFASTLRDDIDATIAAAISLSSVLVFYFVWILNFLDLMKNIPKGAFMIGAIIVIVLNIIYFFYNKRYERIIIRFKSSKPRLIYRILALIFIIFGLFITPFLW